MVGQYNANDLTPLLQNLVRERNKGAQIEQLKRWRRAGVLNVKDGREFEARKRRRLIDELVASHAEEAGILTMKKRSASRAAAFYATPREASASSTDAAMREESPAKAAVPTNTSANASIIKECLGVSESVASAFVDTIQEIVQSNFRAGDMTLDIVKEDGGRNLRFAIWENAPKNKSSVPATQK